MDPSQPLTGGLSPQTSRSKVRVPGLGGVCLLAAVGMHLLVLALPMPPQNEPLPAATEDHDEALPGGEIAIAVLPKPTPTPTAPPIAPSPTPPTSEAPQPVQPVAPLPPKPPSSVTDPPPTPMAEPLPIPFPPVVAAPEPEPEPEVEAQPYADFPHLEGAVATCPDGLGDCWRSPTDSWRSAARTIQGQLEQQGYTLKNVTGDVLSVDTGVQVYAVSQAGELAYYLNLVSVAEGVLYTMTELPINEDAVKNLQQL
jgi:hypothetical protein